jgi:hypothetical protein
VRRVLLTVTITAAVAVALLLLWQTLYLEDVLGDAAVAA